MKAPSIAISLALSAALLAGCASKQKSLNIKFYLFDGNRASRSGAPVLRKREVHTRIDFRSMPEGAAVYAYDEAAGKRDLYLGKTPCNYNVTTYQITEYADMTAEYSLDIPIPHEMTKPIDYSDPSNDYGEITFSFYFEKKGCESRIERIAVKATNEVLVRALAVDAVPGYEISVNLSE